MPSLQSGPIHIFRLISRILFPSLRCVLHASPVCVHFDLITLKTSEDKYKLRSFLLVYLPNLPTNSTFLGLNILLSTLHTTFIHVFLLGPRFSRDMLLLSLPATESAVSTTL